VRRPALVLGLTLGLALPEAPARAQGNYRALPTGGRSALMGDTGVAMARDGSAPFLNPATVVAITDSRVALSFNFYSITSTSIDAFHAPRAPDAPLGRTSLGDLRADALPSTFCLFLTVGREPELKDTADRKLAFCLGTSERTDLFTTDSRSGQVNGANALLHVASIERRWGRVHVGPTYARTIGDALSLGASLHLVDTSATAVTNASSASTGAPGGASATAFTSGTSGTSFDVQMLFGGALRIDRYTNLGVALAPPSLHVAGSVDANDHSQRFAPDTSDYARTRSGTGSFAAPLPARVALGIGRWTPRLRLEADATFFFPMLEAFRSDLTVRSVTQQGAIVDDRTESVLASERIDGVLDSAVGAEVFVGDRISLLGGFATDFSALPRLAADPPLGSVTTTRAQRFIGSFGIGSYGTGSELLFGLQLAFARGQALVGDSFSIPSTLAPVETRSTTLLFVLAGATSLRELRRTFDDLRHTLPRIR
jgi:hypothetical protein